MQERGYRRIPISSVPAVASSKAPVDHTVAGVRTAAAHMPAAVFESAVHKVDAASPWNNSLMAAEAYTAAAAAHTAAALVAAAVHKAVVGGSLQCQLSTPHIQPVQFSTAALDTKT
jgi:hypothetical protein